MTYVNLDTNDFILTSEDDDSFVRVAALGEAFLIERGRMLDGVAVTSESEILPLCVHAELSGLYVNGEWDMYGVRLLVCPTDADMSLTNFARRQLADQAV